MKRGKAFFPEGEDPERRTESFTEEENGEEAHKRKSVVTADDDTCHPNKVMESPDPIEDEDARQAPESLRPTRSSVRRKWLLSAKKNQESGLPLYLPLREENGRLKSSDGQSSGAPRHESEPSFSACASDAHDIKFAGDAGTTEGNTEPSSTQEMDKTKKTQKDIITAKNLPLLRPEGRRRSSLTPGPSSPAKRSPFVKKDIENAEPIEAAHTNHEYGVCPSINPKACVVCVRVRPESLQEISVGGNLCVDTRNSSVGVVAISGYKDRQYSFQFDYVFDQDATQEAVYRFTCECLLEKLLAGYSASIMAYGQTGAGKTYTMLGEVAEYDFHRALTDPTTRGVVPRMLEALFQRILQETRACHDGEGSGEQEHVDEDSEQKDGEKPRVTFSVRASFVEVYNDNVRDLLAPTRDSLCIRDSMCTDNRINHGAVLTEATEVPVATAQEAFGLIYTGFAQRVHGTTLLNERSSRSHAIFQLIIRRNCMAACRVTCSRLCLVDLAGSERVSKADSSGVRLREAQSINKSLLALGNVISAAPQTQKKSQKTHVPYRDSKLTRLLQHSFGGHTFTVLLLCCSPHTYNVKETLSTLRFGDRAANLKNQPLSVEAIDPELLLQRLQELQTELRISQAQNRAYMAQAARQVDTIKMLHAYVSPDVTLREDDKAMLTLALQELPLSTQQQRLQPHHAATTGVAKQPPTASTRRLSKSPALQPSTSVFGPQRKGACSPKAVEYSQGQKKLQQERVRPDKIKENASKRPKTAPFNQMPRPTSNVPQRTAPGGRRPVEQIRLQVTPAKSHQAGPDKSSERKQKDSGNFLPAPASADNQDTAALGETHSCGTTVQYDAAVDATPEKVEGFTGKKFMHATNKEDGRDAKEHGAPVKRNASKISDGGRLAAGGAESKGDASKIARDKTPSRLSKFFSLSRGKSNSSKDPGLRAQQKMELKGEEDKLKR